MPTVYQRAVARRDLVEHFQYLAENAGLETADRFLQRVEASFDDLARQPKIGPRLSLKAPGLDGLRKWRVKDFDNYRIFYVPSTDGVSIVRVLHAARDWWGLFGFEE